MIWVNIGWVTRINWGWYFFVEEAIAKYNHFDVAARLRTSTAPHSSLLSKTAEQGLTETKKATNSSHSVGTPIYWVWSRTTHLQTNSHSSSPA